MSAAESFAYDLARLVQQGVCDALRSNIDLQEDGFGNAFDRLWADTATFPGGKSDRAGAPVLKDSGDLYRSIRPGPVVSSGGVLTAYIRANPYGLQQHHGFIDSDVPALVGRTLEVRRRIRQGMTSGIRKADKLVLRQPIRVPPRPWISLHPDIAEGIVSRAARLLGGS